MHHASKEQAGLLLVILFVCNCSAALANRLNLSVGTEFTSGKYGRTTSTDIWYVPFTARYNRDRVSLRVTIPYISVTGTRSVFVPSTRFDGGFLGAASHDTKELVRRRTQSGLGDIITAFTYNLIYHKPSRTAFNVTGRIKIPTASTSRRLGTGQVDYAVQGDLFKRLSKFNLRATFGYRIRGEPPGASFRNVFYGGVGVGYRLSTESTVGTSFSINQSAVGLQDSRLLSAYFSHRISKNIRFNIYGLKGFSDRSPDWGSGANLQYSY